MNVTVTPYGPLAVAPASGRPKRFSAWSRMARSNVNTTSALVNA